MPLIHQCPHCKGIDLSLDCSTNKITCNKCGYGGKSKKVDIDEKIQEMHEKEVKKLHSDVNTTFDVDGRRKNFTYFDREKLLGDKDGY